MSRQEKVQHVAILAALLVGVGWACAPTPPRTADGQPQPATKLARAAEPTSAALDPPVTVRVGTLGVAAEAGLYVALDRGYFRAEGLDVQLVTFKSGADMVAPLAAGELDFGSNPPDPGTFNAVARGFPLKLAAPESTIPPSDKNAALVVRKDLLSSGKVKGVADLKGLTIGLPNRGTSAQFAVENALSGAGLQLSDVNISVIRFPDMLAALSNGALDAAWNVEPFIATGVRQGIATPLVFDGDLTPGLSLFLIESPSFAKQQPEAAKRFVLAHLKGQRDYFHAFQTSDGDKTSIIQSLVANTPVKDPSIYEQMGMPSVDPNDAIDRQNLETLQEYFVKVGSQSTRIDMAEFVDTTGIDYALERLGRL